MDRYHPGAPPILPQTTTSQAWGVVNPQLMLARPSHQAAAPSKRHPSKQRYQKEQASSHLSPVKKRVKENTPPSGSSTVTNSSAATWPSHKESKSSKGVHASHSQGAASPKEAYKEQRQTIVIPDTPSPAVSVITISSDSEEEEKHCSPKGYVLYPKVCSCGVNVDVFSEH